MRLRVNWLHGAARNAYGSEVLGVERALKIFDACRKHAGSMHVVLDATSLLTVHPHGPREMQLLHVDAARKLEACANLTIAEARRHVQTAFAGKATVANLGARSLWFQSGPWGPAMSHTYWAARSLRFPCRGAKHILHVYRLGKAPPVFGRTEPHPKALDGLFARFDTATGGSFHMVLDDHLIITWAQSGPEAFSVTILNRRTKRMTRFDVSDELAREAAHRALQGDWELEDLYDRAPRCASMRWSPEIEDEFRHLGSDTWPK